MPINPLYTPIGKDTSIRDRLRDRLSERLKNWKKTTPTSSEPVSSPLYDNRLTYVTCLQTTLPQPLTEATPHAHHEHPYSAKTSNEIHSHNPSLNSSAIQSDHSFDMNTIPSSIKRNDSFFPNECPENVAHDPNDVVGDVLSDTDILFINNVLVTDDTTDPFNSI